MLLLKVKSLKVYRDFISLVELVQPYLTYLELSTAIDFPSVKVYSLHMFQMCWAVCYLELSNFLSLCMFQMSWVVCYLELSNFLSLCVCSR